MSELQIEVVPKTFTRRKGELTKIHNKLSKISPKMLDELEKQAYNQNLDPKVRQTAIITLLKLDIEVAKIINADNLTRMLADIKYADKLLGGSTEDDGAPRKGKPAIDFENIMTVEEV